MMSRLNTPRFWIECLGGLACKAGAYCLQAIPTQQFPYPDGPRFDGGAIRFLDPFTGIVEVVNALLPKRLHLHNEEYLLLGLGEGERDGREEVATTEGGFGDPRLVRRALEVRGPSVAQDLKALCRGLFQRSRPDGGGKRLNLIFVADLVGSSVGALLDLAAMQRKFLHKQRWSHKATLILATPCAWEGVSDSEKKQRFAAAMMQEIHAVQMGHPWDVKWLPAGQDRRWLGQLFDRIILVEPTNDQGTIGGPDELARAMGREILFWMK